MNDFAKLISCQIHYFNKLQNIISANIWSYTVFLSSFFGDVFINGLHNFRSSLQWHMSFEHWIKSNAFNLLCFVIIILATMAATMLLCYHTYLMLTGQTTWEQASRQRILYLKDLEMLINPFDEGYCNNISTFLCNCYHVGRNWETIYSKGVYRWIFMWCFIYVIFIITFNSRKLYYYSKDKSMDLFTHQKYIHQ